MVEDVELDIGKYVAAGRCGLRVKRIIGIAKNFQINFTKQKRMRKNYRGTSGTTFTGYCTGGAPYEPEGMNCGGGGKGGAPYEPDGGNDGGL